MTLDSLVPPQTPDNINPLVVSYLEAEFAKLNSKNKLDIEVLHGGKPWVANVKHWNYEAAKKATEVRDSPVVSVVVTLTLLLLYD
jgi:Cys-Gly metallodipeptidase DUG1